MRKPDIPIFEIEPPLLEAPTTQMRLILTAPTGAGESPQLPQMLLDSGLRTDVAHWVGELVYWGSSADAKE